MCFVAVAVIDLLPLALHLSLLQLLKITLQKRLWGRKAFLPMLSQNQESQTHTSRALYEAGAVHWTKKNEHCVQMEREILAVGHNHEAWTFVVVCN